MCNNNLVLRTNNGLKRCFNGENGFKPSLKRYLFYLFLPSASTIAGGQGVSIPPCLAVDLTRAHPSTDRTNLTVQPPPLPLTIQCSRKASIDFDPFYKSCSLSQARVGYFVLFFEFSRITQS